MVSLAANRQKIYFAELEGYTDILDSDGYKTGEKEKSYTAPQEFLIYVSPSKGENSFNPYGIGTDYNNLMSTCDRDCPITEDSVLWIGIDPEIDPGTGKATVDHNYIVTRRAEGLNTIAFAIKRIEVDGSDE